VDKLVAAVEVPLDEERELVTLSDQLDVSELPVRSRALDGDTVARLVVAVTALSLPVLRAWLVARAEHRKSTIVSWGGRRFVGYSAKEVAELADVLSRALDRDGDPSSDPP